MTVFRFIYLAARLGLDDPSLVPVPVTRVVGIKQLAYFDPSASKGAKPQLVGNYPCCVFETVAPDGRRHAHRIYLSADGTGKAELGEVNGKQRDAKKSARKLDGQPSIDGCAVIWGDVEKAPHEIVAEGIENAAAIAYAFTEEIARGEIVLLSAINANGIEAFVPWLATKRVTIAADRDEAKTGAGFKRGEKAARTLARKRLNGQRQTPYLLALPGEPGTSFDFNDLLLRDGVASVRAAIAAAQPIESTEEEDEIERVKAAYPLPLMLGLRVEYDQTENGIWFHKIMVREKDGEKEEIHIPVCTPFGAVALLVLKDADQAYGLRVAVQDMRGACRLVEFERGDQARLGGSEIRARRRAAGLRYEQDGESIALQLLSAANPQTVVTTVHRSGWHEPDVNFSTELREATPQYELALDIRMPPHLVSAGSIEGWQDAIRAAVTVEQCPHCARR